MSESKSTSPDILWTIKEVAARLRVAPNTVRNAIEAGHLGALRLPGKGRGIFRIPENAVREYLEGNVYRPQRTKPAAAPLKGRPLRHIKLDPDDEGS
jgi:excisionase family DNA binding protein